MKLIINADDFGMSKAVTDGIIDGIKAGAISSTTIMANMPFVSYGLEIAKKNKIKCIGLHITITQGKPLTICPTLCDSQGNFANKKTQYENPNLCEQELYNEIIAQKKYVESFGIKITHLDRHHYPEVNPIFLRVFLKIAREFSLPIRRIKGANDINDITMPDVWERAMYSLGSSNNITVQQLKKEIDKFRGTNKSVEIHCHPAYLDEYTTDTINRVKELETLIDCKKQGIFDGIELISFAELTPP